MNSLELDVACIARRDGLAENARAAQALGDGFDALGPLRMSDPAQMLAVERVGNELQTATLARMFGRKVARVGRALSNVIVILRALLHHRQQFFVRGGGFRTLVGAGIRFRRDVE